MKSLLAGFILFYTGLSGCAAAGDGGDLLSDLRVELATVRTASSDKPIQILPLPDVRPLVGTNIDVVLNVLGEPDRHNGQSLTYIFFYLPRTYVGGGPELVIVFDRNGMITGAEWRGSQ